MRVNIPVSIAGSNTFSLKQRKAMKPKHDYGFIARSTEQSSCISLTTDAAINYRNLQVGCFPLVGSQLLLVLVEKAIAFL